jgi:hypothetical protein
MYPEDRACQRFPTVCLKNVENIGALLISAPVSRPQQGFQECGELNSEGVESTGSEMPV